MGKGGAGHRARVGVLRNKHLRHTSFNISSTSRYKVQHEPGSSEFPPPQDYAC